MIKKDKTGPEALEIDLVDVLSSKLSHRGPDENGVFQNSHGHVLFHKRLSIIDLATGKQPIKGCGEAHIVHNGEIYNHQELYKTHLQEKHTPRTTSDSEVILHLFEEFGTDCLNMLDGVFAFAIVDGDKYFVARDPIGVKPLYYGRDEKKNMWFASEMKALTDICTTIVEFPPGHYYTKETGIQKFYVPTWQETIAQDSIPTKQGNLKTIREALEKSVEKRLMSDVPVGVLLSGGLDSSLVSSITKRFFKEKTLLSFSVGIDVHSPDLKAAREVAQFLGTEHHEVIYTVEEGIQMLEKTIYHLESYDVTTIRAGIPMLILSEYIKKQGIKVVLSGEGADELFGGYLYFNQAPNDKEFYLETVRRVEKLYTSDVLRADRTTMAQSIEARVPFLDLNFIKEVMEIHPTDKRPGRNIGKIEKEILRMAFDTPDSPYLPQHILWRQKEQFSDGVGYGWIDGLRDQGESMVNDTEFSKACKLYPHNTPPTKEAYLYREIFEKLFQHDSATKAVHQWIPKWQTNKDPSGRANNEHVSEYQSLDFLKEANC